ncbi:60S ribosomal protein L31-like [Ananas comosus]|uniref:60S ribosomal protein L31-like n=2 Tax=Ananas comosus TaxID=4615 RepID=A0A6P5G572_ANACO|nr:60S ribosomal protein L31-like [Ananas comosus]
MPNGRSKDDVAHAVQILRFAFAGAHRPLIYDRLCKWTVDRVGAALQLHTPRPTYSFVAGLNLRKSPCIILYFGRARRSSYDRTFYVLDQSFPILSTFKKMAPKAIKEIRKFAQKAMGTLDVRVDVKLNKHIWSRGVRSVPRRLRVRIARRRNDEEDAKEELYSLVTVAEVPPEGLKGLGAKAVDDDDDAE